MCGVAKQHASTSVLDFSACIHYQRATLAFVHFWKTQLHCVAQNQSSGMLWHCDFGRVVQWHSEKIRNYVKFSRYRHEFGERQKEGQQWFGYKLHWSEQRKSVVLVAGPIGLEQKDPSSNKVARSLNYFTSRYFCSGSGNILLQGHRRTGRGFRLPRWLCSYQIQLWSDAFVCQVQTYNFAFAQHCSLSLQ